MKRLAKENRNTPEKYDEIFLERSKKCPDWFDIRRWKTLLRYYYGGVLCDIGCLDSRIPEMIKGPYYGIDISQKALDSMKEEHPFNTLFLERDIYNTLFGDGSFDYCVMGEVLEHLERPQDAIKEAFRILKSGGVLAVSVPLEEEKEIGAVDGELHLWSFSKSDIIDLLQPHGKTKTKVLGSRWFPYRYSWKTLIAWTIKK